MNAPETSSRAPQTPTKTAPLTPQLLTPRSTSFREISARHSLHCNTSLTISSFTSLLVELQCVEKDEYRGEASKVDLSVTSSSFSLADMHQSFGAKKSQAVISYRSGKPSAMCCRPDQVAVTR